MLIAPATAREVIIAKGAVTSQVLGSATAPEAVLVAVVVVACLDVGETREVVLIVGVASVYGTGLGVGSGFGVRSGSGSGSGAGSGSDVGSIEKS